MIRTLNTRCGNICAAFTTNLHHVISHDAMELARWQPQDELEVDMDEPGRMERDPVCGMMVGEWEHQVVHRGVGYAFCSQQCRERFSSGPGLYVGRRRVLAPKQKGMEVIKRRRMRLGVPLTQARLVELQDTLLSMMGVIAVRPVERMHDAGCNAQPVQSGTRMTDRIELVEITYDLLQATALQLEHKIAQLDATLSNGWGEKLQRDFIHYLEKCELDDLEIRDTNAVRWNRSARRTESGLQRRAVTQIEHGRTDLAA